MRAYAAEASAAAHEVPFYAEPEIWLAVAFGIFVALLAKPVWRRLAGGLDARAAQIRAELDEARSLREEAQAQLAAYQRKQRDAAKEAADILRHAEEESKRIAADSEKALEETIARREKLTEEKIAQAQARAVDEVKAEAVEVALEATRRLLAEKLDEGRADALIEDAIKEIPKRLQ